MKTDFALRLIERGEYYFLSRPRRFGKSLFIDTLSDLFLGKKVLFEGLAVYEQWDWDVHYPVIHIEFNTGNFKSGETIEKRILNILQENQRRWEVECEDKDDISSCFAELIGNIHDKEIQSSLNELFIQYLTDQTSETIHHQDKIYDDVMGNLEQLERDTIFIICVDSVDWCDCISRGGRSKRFAHC